MVAACRRVVERAKRERLREERGEGGRERKRRRRDSGGGRDRELISLAREEHTLIG